MVDDTHARFLATLSHDLRGGLHGVQLALEMLHRDVQDSRPVEQVLEDIRLARLALNDCAVRADRLISARRLEAGLIPARLADMDAVESIRQAMAQATGVADEYTQRVQAHLPDRWTIRSDARLLGLIVGGLLDHALRRTAGTIVVSADPATRAVRIMAEARWLNPADQAALTVFGGPLELDAAMIGLHVARLAAAALNVSLLVERDGEVVLRL